MIKFRHFRPNRKKKIADALAATLAESRAFDTAKVDKIARYSGSGGARKFLSAQERGGFGGEVEEPSNRDFNDGKNVAKQDSIKESYSQKNKNFGNEEAFDDGSPVPQYSCEENLENSEPSGKTVSENPIKSEKKIFDSRSPEFAEAVKKLSPDLLALLDSQFSASPVSLVHGYFQKANGDIHPDENLNGASGDIETQDIADIEHSEDD